MQKLKQRAKSSHNLYIAIILRFVVFEKESRECMYLTYSRPYATDFGREQILSRTQNRVEHRQAEFFAMHSVLSHGYCWGRKGAVRKMLQ